MPNGTEAITGVVDEVVDTPGGAEEVVVSDEGVVGDDGEPIGGQEEVVGDEVVPGGEKDGAAAGKDKAKEQVEDEDPSLYERDGRKVDDKTRRVLAELKKTNPIAAKGYADAYFHKQAYEKEFPTVQAAREARAVIESLGGQEGIGKLQEEVTDYRNEIDQFARGDKGLIETLYDSNPEALVTSAQNSLDVLREKDPKAFQMAMLPSFVEAFENAEVPQTIAKVMQLVYDGKGQEAFDTLALIKKWYDGVKGRLTNHRETRSRIDPERQKLQEDRKKFEQEQAQQRDTQVNTDVNVENNKVLARTVEPFFNEMKLKTPGKKAFVSQLQSGIWDAMREDAPFKATAARIKATGDKQRYVEYVAGKFAELLPVHFEELRNSLYPNYKATRPGASRGAAAPAKAGANGNGKPAPAAAATDWLRVNEAPKPQDIDYSKTDSMMIVKGRYILKSGKKLVVV